MSLQRYGWKPDIPDFRDHLFAGVTPMGSLPPRIDLRPNDGPIFDQGQLGSCTGNAISGHMQYLYKRSNITFTPSRLFIYYNERLIEGTVNTDSGALIRDGIKSVNKQGACSETTWPYDITKWRRKPSIGSYKEALQHQSVEYLRLDGSITQIKQCLADGFPFVFGFTVYDSFESPEVARTGIMPMPTPKDAFMGGHAVMAVGYDNDRGVVIVRNSWGTSWGDHGYFYMPYAYITNPNLAADFWTIRKVET